MSTKVETPALFDLAAIIPCKCGHRALDHHGVDNSAVSGGCFGDGAGHPWSSVSKCACVMTCTEVMECSR